MFLYMMAFMLTTVIEQALFVNKACKVNHGFNDTICNNINLNKYKDQHEIVQVIIRKCSSYFKMTFKITLKNLRYLRKV